MKILVIQDYLRSGGTERQAVLLANAFAAAGHATTLLTFRPGGRLTTRVEKNVRRRALQPFDTHLDWFAPGLFRESARLQPDVILCLGRMANCYAGGLQRQHPTTVVVATMRTGKTLPALFRRSLRLVRHIVANSQDAGQALVDQHAIPAAKISVIHNSLVFPDTPVVENPPAHLALRGEYGATPQTFVLLCVAMFRPEKNQRELIEIAAGLPAESDWQLWLAGDGPTRSACERLVAEKNLDARVKFTGFVRDPAALYRAAQIAVHASSSEALSNFLIEAQAHGLPAVVYAAQGMAECFLPGDTGFVIPRDNRALFRATLLRLMNEAPAIRKERAARAKAFAKNSFDPERQVAAYLELFQKLKDSSVHDQQAAH